MELKNDSLLKFSIENDTVTASISIKDLIWLFNECPYNFDGETKVATVTSGKEPEFVKWIIIKLQDDAPYEADDLVWSQPLTYCFEQLLEDYKPEFLTYSEDY